MGHEGLFTGMVMDDDEREHRRDQSRARADEATRAARRAGELAAAAVGAGLMLVGTLHTGPATLWQAVAIIVGIFLVAPLFTDLAIKALKREEDD